MDGPHGSSECMAVLVARYPFCWLCTYVHCTGVLVSHLVASCVYLHLFRRARGGLALPSLCAQVAGRRFLVAGRWFPPLRLVAGVRFFGAACGAGGFAPRRWQDAGPKGSGRFLQLSPKVRGPARLYSSGSGGNKKKTVSARCNGGVHRRCLGAALAARGGPSNVNTNQRWDDLPDVM